jgi:hypothetical protein
MVRYGSLVVASVNLLSAFSWSPNAAERRPMFVEIVADRGRRCV